MPHVGAPLDSETSEPTGIITSTEADENVEMTAEEVEKKMEELEKLAEANQIELNSDE